MICEIIYHHCMCLMIISIRARTHLPYKSDILQFTKALFVEKMFFSKINCAKYADKNLSIYSVGLVTSVSCSIES